MCILSGQQIQKYGSKQLASKHATLKVTCTRFSLLYTEMTVFRKHMVIVRLFFWSLGEVLLIEIRLQSDYRRAINSYPLFQSAI